MDFKTWLTKNGVDEVITDFMKQNQFNKTLNVHYYQLKINDCDLMLSTCVQQTATGKVTTYVLGNYYKEDDTTDATLFIGSSRNQLKETLKVLSIKLTKEEYQRRKAETKKRMQEYEREQALRIAKDNSVN